MEVYVDDMLVKSKEESPRRSLRDIHHSKKISDEVKPQQVHLWGVVREILRVHGVLERNRSEPRECISHTRDGVAQDHERSLEAHKKDSKA